MNKLLKILSSDRSEDSKRFAVFEEAVKDEDFAKKFILALERKERGLKHVIKELNWFFSHALLLLEAKHKNKLKPSLFQKEYEEVKSRAIYFYYYQKEHCRPCVPLEYLKECQSVDELEKLFDELNSNKKWGTVDNCHVDALIKKYEELIASVETLRKEPKPDYQKEERNARLEVRIYERKRILTDLKKILQGKVSKD